MWSSLVPASPRLATVVSVALALCLLGPSAAASQEADPASSGEPVDLDAVRMIKEEGLERSKVMETMSWLTDVHGPRLTGSPALDDAAEWAIETLSAWGLDDVRKEEWGEFGLGWSNEHFEAHMVAPEYAPLIGYPMAWTEGTGGPVRGEAVVAVVESEEDLEALRGRLEGKIVLSEPAPELEPLWHAPARRLTDDELDERAAQPDPSPRRRFDYAAYRARRELARKAMTVFREEGALAVVETGRGSLGTVFVSSGGPRDPDEPRALPRVALAAEHYGRIVRIVEKGIPVELELDIRNAFHDETTRAYNVVAEIPGTDLADEVVMLGGHFDSWHAGTGATDNAAGSAVMMEAVRILEATGLPLRRTVRIALWSGEEQGLLGSRAYVREHFADPGTMELEPEHRGLSAYFNVDNGGGAIRGVHLQGNDAVAPIFRAWMEPFRNMGMTTLAIRDTGGTDHLAFDAVGLPGFQFIQDPLDYSSRTHHSNMDVYERIVPRDMMFNAVIVASFVYHAANRDELLPREPLPEARSRSAN